jgi:ribonucleoside-diphosphate reductase alpha chain
VVAATAAVIRWRCEQLGTLPAAKAAATPMTDSLISRDEPRTDPSGTLAWAVDIDNPATGEAFTVMLEEVTLPGADGAPVTRPCALALAGNYPRAYDGLARLLSLDMRVVDPAWIGMKLRKLLNDAEPLGHFMAFVPGLPPGQRRQQTWPSNVAAARRAARAADPCLESRHAGGIPLQGLPLLLLLERGPSSRARACPCAHRRQ